MMTKEERELIQAAQQGDQEAFEELVRRHEKQVYGLALRVCGNPEDAAEAAQEAFLSAWQGLRFFRQKSEFSTWHCRLTSNAAIDLQRRKKRHRGDASLDDELSPEAPDRTSLTPQDALEQKELGELIQKGLNDLSADHRQVLVLREMYQMSYQEISDVLDQEQQEIVTQPQKYEVRLKIVEIIESISHTLQGWFGGETETELSSVPDGEA